MIIPVILAGGSGTRLWPLSRRLYPKQLLNLTRDRSLLQQTALRVAGAEGMCEPIIMCNETYRYIIADQLKAIGVPPHVLVLEPMGRNTAPAVAVAAIIAMKKDPGAMLLILPSDHLISEVDVFHRAIDTAACFAGQKRLVTFGVVPQSPETGYGYIRQGGDITCHGNKTTHSAFEIREFVEKPDLPTALDYVESGEYCWNSGMFMFRVEDIITEMEYFAPEIMSACRRSVEKGVADSDVLVLDSDAFSICPSDSVDYAIMEKTRRGVMVPFDAGWNDVGSWEALWDLGVKDETGNVLKGDVRSQDNRDCLVYAESRLVAVLGMSDAIVIESPDAVLVAGRGRGQEVRSIVDALRVEERKEASLHNKTFHQWGHVKVQSEDPLAMTRRITLNALSAVNFKTPAARVLHWVVVEGRGIVRRAGDSIALERDMSVKIDPELDVILENPGKEPLVLMEVYLQGSGDGDHFSGKP